MSWDEPTFGDEFARIEVEAMGVEVRRYLEAVIEVVSDLTVDIAEVERVRLEQDQLNLSAAELRAVHAKVFQVLLARFSEEHRVDDSERLHLRHLHHCLAALGWAPGE